MKPGRARRAPITGVTPKPYYSYHEVGFLLGGRSYDAVKKLVTRGKIKAKKMGDRRSMIPHSEVMRFQGLTDLDLF